jgi:hypothetical protein
VASIARVFDPRHNTPADVNPVSDAGTMSGASR